MKDPLETEARRRIYGHLKASPGAHFSELQRALTLATGTLQYHLQYLERRGLIDARQDGKYTRYYASLDVDRRWKPALGLLRQPTPRRVVVDILEHGPSQLSAISGRTGVPASTLSFHLKKLIVAEVVARAGRGTYQLTDPDQMIVLLSQYRAGFLDAAVDRIVGLLTGVRAGTPPPRPPGDRPGGEDATAGQTTPAGPADEKPAGSDGKPQSQPLSTARTPFYFLRCLDRGRVRASPGRAGRHCRLLHAHPS